MNKASLNNCCLICGKRSFKDYYYPEVHFNNKVFKYIECTFCSSAQINPLPSGDDYDKMYGETDHAYLQSMKEDEKIDFERSFPTYNHRTYQKYFFDEFKYGGPHKTLLDYGCGSGYYMYHAQKKGMICTGVEFNGAFADLMSKKTGLNITTLDKINGKTFDVIHLGHVLEHMENPMETLHSLKKHAHASTVFVIDGPLEKNRCLSRFIIKTGSLLQRKKYNTYPPQHLTFTNHRSQLLFFERAGLEKMNYKIAEQMFPLPESFSIKNPAASLLFLLSKLSIFISSLSPQLGNIFHYAGRLP